MGVNFETFLNVLGKGLQGSKGFGGEPWGAGISALAKGLAKRREEKEEETLTGMLTKMLPPEMQERVAALSEKPVKGMSGILEALALKTTPSATVNLGGEDITVEGLNELARTGRLPTGRQQQPQEEGNLDRLADFAQQITGAQDSTPGVPGKDFPLEDTPLGKAVFQKRPTKAGIEEKEYNFLRGKGLSHDKAMDKIYPERTTTAAMEKFKVSETEKKQAKQEAEKEKEDRILSSFFEFSWMNNTMSRGTAAYLQSLAKSDDPEKVSHAKKIKELLEIVNKRKTVFNLSPEQYQAEIEEVLGNLKAFE